MENNPHNVLSAFDLLIEQIDEEIVFIKERGKTAFDSGNYSLAKEALDYVQAVERFRDKVVALGQEWKELARKAEAAEDEETQRLRRTFKKLRRGERTPEPAYYRPILQTLVKLGGRARVCDVLDRVYELMRPQLKPMHFEPLPGDPDVPRWRNCAMWARNTMVKQGLICDDSPRGIWEITEKGRQWLRENGEQLDA